MHIVQLTKTYNNKPLFKNLNLEFTAQKTLCLGANGIGKSSLLLMIAGLESYAKGQILWRDQNTPVQKKQVTLATDGMALPEFLTMRQVIELAANQYQVAYPHALVTLFGLQDFAHSKLAQLSQGTLKKISLVLAWIKPAKLVLLDEPTVALDATSVAHLQTLLRTDPRKFIVVTHDQASFAGLGFENVQIG
jgi:ABC-2 type transport system ATP-binding protein